MLQKISRQLLQHRVALLFVLTAWTAYGFMTNSSDVNAYGLYQIGAESIVEFQTYTLGHSYVPGWRDAGDGDIFIYHGHRFPAKQPGAFFATAAPYFVFHHFFDMSFQNDQDRVSSYNAWFSGGLAAAIAVGVFYEILLLLEFSFGISVVTTFCFAFGTLFFPYSGISHHDIMATTCILFAFFFLLRFRMKAEATLWLAGMWLGFTLFFSMLPALLVACLALYGLTLTQNLKEWLKFGLGFLVGYLPLGIVNSIYFGNPFIQANMAGNYQDTFFNFSLQLMAEHFHDYFGITSFLSATQIMPVFCIGILGLLFLKHKFLKEKILFFALLAIHLFYLFNITTIGHCQFGPRYLIPLIPFTLIGLASLLKSNTSLRKRYRIPVSIFVGISILYSVGSNTLGAYGITMYCSVFVESPLVAFFDHLEELGNDQFFIRPLCGVMVLVICAFLFFLQKRNALPLNRDLKIG